MNYSDFPALRALVEERERLIRAIESAKINGAVAVTINGAYQGEAIAQAAAVIVLEHLRGELAKAESGLRALGVTF